MVEWSPVGVVAACPVPTIEQRSEDREGAAEGKSDHDHRCFVGHELAR
jgi:hypothetical protein